MCGIIGVVSINVNKYGDWLKSQSESIYHRGPDDFGLFWSGDKKVGLAHRRLSILDLSSDGHQPMHYVEAGLTIVFNGEIYNHSEIRSELKGDGYFFKSKTDTEVVLKSYAKWGDECFKKFNGMFAIAIYDAFKGELILGRDRAGEKPLFYQLSSEGFFFSSELTPLLNNKYSKNEIDIDSLDYYLACGYLQPNKSMIRGVNKVNPGSFIRYKINSNIIEENPYWVIPEYDESNVGFCELIDSLQFLLEDSVRLQMKADVPIGILLSGGIDSSIITSLASQHSSILKTFTVGFSDYPELNELNYARKISNYFGTEHAELLVNKINDDTVLDIARKLDEPLGDSSIIPTYLVSNLISQYCKVALGGDGGDEIFGGYTYYQKLLANSKRNKLIPHKIRNLLAKISCHTLRDGFRGKNYLAGLMVDLDKSLPLAPSIFSKKTRQMLIDGVSTHKGNAKKLWEDRIPSEDDLIQRVTRMDFLNYLPGDILTKVDRASMLNSIELRSPYLDYRIIDFGFSKIPSSMKVCDSDKKIILKNIGKKILPKNFDYQRKQGFSIPLGEWLKNGKIRDMMMGELLESSCIFDKKMINQLFIDQRHGYSNSERIFTIFQFEVWRKKNLLNL